MSGPEKPDTPNRENKADAETPEAEIVDDDTAKSMDDGEYLEGETIDPDAETSSGTPEGSGIFSPGVLLVSFLAIVAIGLFLSQGMKAGKDKPTGTETVSLAEAKAKDPQPDAKKPQKEQVEKADKTESFGASEIPPKAAPEKPAADHGKTAETNKSPAREELTVADRGTPQEELANPAKNEGETVAPAAETASVEGQPAGKQETDAAAAGAEQKPTATDMAQQDAAAEEQKAIAKTATDEPELSPAELAKRRREEIIAQARARRLQRDAEKSEDGTLPKAAQPVDSVAEEPDDGMSNKDPDDVSALKEAGTSGADTVDGETITEDASADDVTAEASVEAEIETAPADGAEDAEDNTSAADTAAPEKEIADETEPAPAQATNNVTVTNRKLEETESQLAEMKIRNAEQEKAIADIKDELKELLARETEKTGSDADDTIAQSLQQSEQKIAELEERLNKLQNRELAEASKQATISIALANLQQKVYSGRPFTDQLSLLRRFAPEIRNYNALEPYAEDGLPTMVWLREAYAEYARKALAAEDKANAKGPMERVGANLRNLFSVRPVGMVEGDTPSAITARAETYLEEEDLAACLRELNQLSGPAMEAMAPWTEKARARIEAEKLMDDISNAILNTTG